MDLNDIWQEHKTWIIGCFAGLVAFLVGNAVVYARIPAAWRAEIGR